MMPEFEPENLLSVLLGLPAADVVPMLRRLLAAEVGAVDVLVHLVNYRKTRLRELGPPVTGAPGGVGLHRDQSVVGTPAGSVFTSQLPLLPLGHGQRVVRAPLTVRGQRLGVLSVTLSAEPPGAGGPGVDDGLASWLARVAGVLALVLHVAAEGSDVMELARRGGRLSVAAEMQWQLLPGTALAGPSFLVAGHLEPARHVGGDAFDWAHDSDDLWLAVADADGDADGASLACTLAVSALRNARRSRLPLARQAALADQAVSGEFHGARTVSVLLARLSLSTGSTELVCAGTPILLRLSGPEVQVVLPQEQPPLGAAGDWSYQPQQLQFAPGDRLLGCTSGAISTAGPSRPPFGVAGVAMVLRGTAGVSPHEVVRLLARDLLAHSGGELDDDAALVCLDWSPDRPAG